jgi:hypothetical protein
VPDADELLAKSEKLMADYFAGDVTGAWKQFFALANIHLPDEVVEMMFGGQRDAEQEATERFWFGHEMRESITWVPDVDKLRTVDIVIGIGEESTGQLCDRTSTALADRLGIEPTRFPGDHTGFVDRPGPFAEALRTLLGAVQPRG